MRLKTKHVRVGKQHGFSLIEVTMAIGIVAFAFVGLMGLLPVGMSAFNHAIDSTVEAQIAQRVFAEAQQVKFTDLDQVAGLTYFDQEGTMIGENQPPAEGFIYEVKVNPPEETSAQNAYVRSVRVEIGKNRTIESLRNEDPSAIRQFTFIVADVGI